MVRCYKPEPHSVPSALRDDPQIDAFGSLNELRFALRAVYAHLWQVNFAVSFGFYKNGFDQVARLSLDMSFNSHL